MLIFITISEQLAVTEYFTMPPHLFRAWLTNQLGRKINTDRPYSSEGRVSKVNYSGQNTRYDTRPFRPLDSHLVYGNQYNLP